MHVLLPVSCLNNISFAEARFTRVLSEPVRRHFVTYRDRVLSAPIKGAAVIQTCVSGSAIERGRGRHLFAFTCFTVASFGISGILGDATDLDEHMWFRTLEAALHEVGTTCHRLAVIVTATAAGVILCDDSFKHSM